MYNHQWKQEMDKLVAYTAKQDKYGIRASDKQPNHSLVMISLHPKAETLRYSKVAKAII